MVVNMDRQAKSAIKALVLELRHTLEDDIAIQLKRYGYAGARWIEADKLPHLWTDDTAMAERQRIDAALAQELRRIDVDDPAQTTAARREEAVGWFVREIAYTHLNRLAALKALEVRGLIPEVITTRESYGGRSRAHYDLRNAQPGLCGNPDDGLEEAIRQSCRQMYREFRRRLSDIAPTLQMDMFNAGVQPARQEVEAFAAKAREVIRLAT
jgi:hypothetical protein